MSFSNNVFSGYQITCMVVVQRMLECVSAVFQKKADSIEEIMHIYWGSGYDSSAYISLCFSLQHAWQSRALYRIKSCMIIQYQYKISISFHLGVVLVWVGTVVLTQGQPGHNFRM